MWSTAAWRWPTCTRYDEKASCRPGLLCRPDAHHDLSPGAAPGRCGARSAVGQLCLALRPLVVQAQPCSSRASRPGSTPRCSIPSATMSALSETILASKALALPWLLAGGEVVAFNAVVLLSFVLSGFTMYLLALRLTGNRWAALLSGVIYAFAPYRIHALAAGWIPLLPTQWLPLDVPLPGADAGRAAGAPGGAGRASSPPSAPSHRGTMPTCWPSSCPSMCWCGRGPGGLTCATCACGARLLVFLVVAGGHGGAGGSAGDGAGQLRPVLVAGLCRSLVGQPGRLRLAQRLPSAVGPLLPGPARRGARVSLVCAGLHLPGHCAVAASIWALRRRKAGASVRRPQWSPG